MSFYCKKCGVQIPERRVKMGYTDSCVVHSSTQKFTGLVVADDKSTTWVNIIRDEQTSKHIEKLIQSRGKQS